MSNTTTTQQVLREAREALRRLLDASFEDAEGMHRFAEDVLPAYAIGGAETAIASIDAALSLPAAEVQTSEDQEAARTLAQMIEGHQYGLRGFGDGSLSRGRNLTDSECRLIRKALTALAASPQAAQPVSAPDAAPAGEPAAQPVAWRWQPSQVFADYAFTDDPARVASLREHGYAPEPLYSSPIKQEMPEAAPIPAELNEVLEFLYGAAPLDGVWFGGKPKGKPYYWWRSKLRAAIERAVIAQKGKGERE